MITLNIVLYLVRFTLLFNFHSGFNIHSFLPFFFPFFVFCLSNIYWHSLFIYLFILFLAALSLRCCTRAFSSCGERGLLFLAVPGLLIAVASLVAEHGL